MPKPSKRQQALIEANQVIDDIIAPERMSAEDAKAFLEELTSDIEAKIDGLKSDIKEAAKHPRR